MLVKLKGKHFDVNLIQVYVPTAQCVDEEIEKFYEDLELAKSKCKSQEIVIIMGDLNAKVGEGRSGKIVEDFGLGVRNERGERFVEWCTNHNQIITNTWFKHHNRRRWAWRSPNGVVKNQIDYITINERFRNSITQAKTYPGADCGSDHVPVICNFRVKLKKLPKAGVLRRITQS